MEYLDFDLEVGLRQGEVYPVAVRSPAGEAQGSMRFPFDGPALESRLKTLRQTLRDTGYVPRPSLQAAGQSMQAFGQQLFDALLASEVRSRYDVSRREAQLQQVLRKGDVGLRLRLHLQAPELAVVPWEYLYDARQGEYVCLSRHTPLVRYLNLPQALPPLKVPMPLHILGMVASPSDQPALDVQQEQDRLQEALRVLEDAGLVRLKWLKGSTWEDLQWAMLHGPWHILHFIGHGGFDPTTQEGVLALADRQGKTRLLRAPELGRLLADHQSLRLVVLNACEGARSSEVDLFSSTAATLARRGVPAVLAMQAAISDQAALQCTRTFYQVLAAARPVDEAVAEARKAISLQLPNSLEWGIPVLYLRAASGLLFDLPPEWQAGTLITSLPPLVRKSAAPILPPLPPTYLPTLLVFSLLGNTPPQQVVVPAEGLTIGRERTNDLALADPNVSRQHLHLTWQEGAWQITRQPQAGPLYVNGRQQGQAALQPGDQLVFGGTVVRFERRDAQAGLRNLGSEDEPLLLTPEPVPHLTIDWPGGRFVAPLREEHITIGRAPDSGLVIPAPVISTLPDSRPWGTQWAVLPGNSHPGASLPAWRSPAHWCTSRRSICGACLCKL
jgi:pSer/pThr/pTyr-binding forkhead associated (FHA) protein/CHAT domain-containing protein